MGQLFAPWNWPGIGYEVADDRATPFVWAGLRGYSGEPRSKTGVRTRLSEKVVEVRSTEGLLFGATYFSFGSISNTGDTPHWSVKA